MGEHDNEELARRFYEEFWRRGISDGNWVVARFTMRGTHRGDFYGIAATNRTVEAGGIDLLRFSDGLIAEWILCEDTLGVFAQLGALPAVLSGVAGPGHAG
jgi:predicted ester cyclase